MPAAIAFDAQFAAHRDQFVVLTVHDESLKTLAEVDAKTPPLEARYWGGRPLPFPVLLDAAGDIEKRFGINAHPTGLLIDPAGNLVGEADIGDLAARLPAVPAAVAWAAQRDRYNVRTFRPGPAAGQPADWPEFAAALKRDTTCEVEIDAIALKAAGLDPAAGPPARVFGGVSSWRTCEELCLTSHGLGVVPSADGKRLVVTRRPPAAEPPSPVQRQASAELKARLDRPAAPAKPVVLTKLPLAEAAARVADECDVTIALDPAAIHAKKLDPGVNVSATFGPEPLRQSLATLLAPAGLTAAERAGVVWVTPAAK